MTTTTAPIDETTPATALHRAFAVQLGVTSEALRQAWDRVAVRIRTALDLPSRGELASLAARLDAIDARLATLSAGEATAADAHDAKDSDGKDATTEASDGKDTDSKDDDERRRRKAGRRS